MADEPLSPDGPGPGPEGEDGLDTTDTFRERYGALSERLERRAEERRSQGHEVRIMPNLAAEALRASEQLREQRTVLSPMDQLQNSIPPATIPETFVNEAHERAVSLHRRATELVAEGAAAFAAVRPQGTKSAAISELCDDFDGPRYTVHSRLREAESNYEEIQTELQELRRELAARPSGHLPISATMDPDAEAWSPQLSLKVLAGAVAPERAAALTMMSISPASPDNAGSRSPSMWMAEQSPQIHSARSSIDSACQSVGGQTPATESGFGGFQRVGRHMKRMSTLTSTRKLRRNVSGGSPDSLGHSARRGSASPNRRRSVRLGESTAAQANAECERLKERLRKLEASHKAEVDSLRDDVERVQREKSAALNRAQKAEQALAAARKERGALGERAQHAEAKVDALVARAAEFEGECSELKQRNGRLASQLTEARGRADELEKSLELRMRELGQTAADLRASRAEVLRTAEREADVNAKLDDAVALADAYLGEKEDLEEALEKEHAERGAIEAELEQTKVLARDLGDRCRQLQAQLTGAQVCAEEGDDRLRDLSVRLEQVQKAHAELLEDRNALAERADVLDTELREVQRAAATAQEEFQRKELQMEKYMSERAREWKSEEKELHMLRSQIGRLVRELSAKTELLVAAAQRQKQLRSSWSRLLWQGIGCRKQLRRAEEQLAARADADSRAAEAAAQRDWICERFARTLDAAAARDRAVGQLRRRWRRAQGAAAAAEGGAMQCHDSDAGRPQRPAPETPLHVAAQRAAAQPLPQTPRSPTQAEPDAEPRPGPQPQQQAYPPPPPTPPPPPPLQPELPPPTADQSAAEAPAEHLADTGAAREPPAHAATQCDGEWSPRSNASSATGGAARCLPLTTPPGAGRARRALSAGAAAVADVGLDGPDAPRGTAALSLRRRRRPRTPPAGRRSAPPPPAPATQQDWWLRAAAVATPAGAAAHLSAMSSATGSDREAEEEASKAPPRPIVVLDRSPYNYFAKKRTSVQQQEGGAPLAGGADAPGPPSWGSWRPCPTAARPRRRDSGRRGAGSAQRPAPAPHRRNGVGRRARPIPGELPAVGASLPDRRARQLFANNVSV